MPQLYKKKTPKNQHSCYRKQPFRSYENFNIFYSNFKICKYLEVNHVYFYQRKISLAKGVDQSFQGLYENASQRH